VTSRSFNTSEHRECRATDDLHNATHVRLVKPTLKWTALPIWNRMVCGSGISKPWIKTILGTTLFSDITHRVVVIPYRRFGTDRLSRNVGKEPPLLAV